MSAQRMAAWSSAPIKNSLIRVDALVGFLADEKIGNKFDDTRIRVALTKSISGTFDLSILKSQGTSSAESGVIQKISW